MMCARLRGTLKMLAASTNPPGFLINPPRPQQLHLLYFHRGRLRSFECRRDFSDLSFLGLIREDLMGRFHEIRAFEKKKKVLF